MSSASKKIRVVHYCNQLSVGGTERTMELFCKYLDREKFELFAVSRIHHVDLATRLRILIGAGFGHGISRGKKRLWNSMNARTPNFQRILGKENLFFARSDEHLRKLISNLSPDILHVHYSGAAEPPTSDEDLMSRIPVVVTTNPFEKENTATAHRHVKKILFVSNWLLKNKALWAAGDHRAGVLYNPIENPIVESDLRDALKIPKHAFVIGRVGRADPGIHDPIALKAFRQIEDDNTYFIALSPPENMIRQAKALSLKNFIALPASTDENFLSQFYNTIDVLAHARRDGETFGCNIAEAMIHGAPVVSHYTSFMNAQDEVIGDTGFVCHQDDWQEYAAKLAMLKSDADLRKDLGSRAKKRAEENFEARMLTKKLESLYETLLAAIKQS